MRNIYQLGIALFLFFALNNSIFAAYGYFGDCPSFIQVNGQFYQAAGCSGSPDPSINGVNLGTVSSLIINYVEQQTFENGGDDVTNGIWNYRIFETGTTPGAFIPVPLTDITAPGNGDEKRFASINLDLYTGLNTGTPYTVEFYYNSDVDWNPNDGSTDDTIFESNGGANYSFGFTTMEAPVSVELLDFKAKNKSNMVQLMWSTATEANSEKFIIERSADGQNWNAIGETPAANFSSTIINYSFTDEFPFANKNYYRLKQIDFDQKYSFSAVLQISHQLNTEFNIYPNPATEFINIKGHTSAKDQYGIILDASGQYLQQLDLSDQHFFVQIPLSGWIAGNYYLQIFDKHHYPIELISFSVQ